MSRIELVFERLHVAVQEQMAALESCPDPARWPVLGAYLRCTIDRLDRVAVLIVVRATRGRSLVSQRSIAAKLDALHGRAEALLAGIQHGDDMETRRFATRLAALDPLASARSGPDGLVDLSEKVVTGVPISAARRYCTEDGGPLAASHAFLAGVTIRDADLRMAQLSRTRLLDLDARGVRLGRRDRDRSAARAREPRGSLDAGRGHAGHPCPGLRLLRGEPRVCALGRRHGESVARSTEPSWRTSARTERCSSTVTFEVPI